MGMAEFPDEFLRTPKTTIQSGVLIINVNNNHYQLLIYPFGSIFTLNSSSCRKAASEGIPEIYSNH